MPTLQIQLPDFVTIEAQEIQLLIAAKLYEQGQLSLGQSAQLAGLSQRTFMEWLGKYNVSVFNYDTEAIGRDFSRA